MVRKRSEIWNHFSQAGTAKAKCVYCSAIISTKCGSTGNLTRHMRLKHSGTPIYREKRNMSPAPSSTTSEEADTVETRASLSGQEIESALETIVYKILPSELLYSTENAPTCNEENTGKSEATEGISSVETVAETHVPRSSITYEHIAPNGTEIMDNETSLRIEGRINRKRKRAAVDLATIAKLMKDYLDYQKESDRQFLEMERQWQEREERLRREDRDHSLYMLKLLLAKKQEK